MAESLVVTEPTALTHVTDVIHDCWFCVSEIALDSRTKTLTFPFKRPSPVKGKSQGLWPFRARKVSYIECFLRIHNVRTWHVEDEQKVEFYDFNEVHYEPEHDFVHITTGVPISIDVEVDRLEISVEVTDRVVEIRKQRLPFGRP